MRFEAREVWVQTPALPLPGLLCDTQAGYLTPLCLEGVGYDEVMFFW